MRILLIDIDSLRPDHLGCNGYHRRTSPNIDRVAAEGMRLTNCYVSDAPCLPSRTALITGQPGIHTGVVSLGGTCAEPFPGGPNRGFQSAADRLSLFESLGRNSYHAVCMSSFANRHAAWHFLAGVRELHCSRSDGGETAEVINSFALPWLQQHAKKDDWILHLNYWDPHRPYRTPEKYGNPFENEPPPSWMTEEIRQRHWNGCGLQSAQDPNDGTAISNFPRMPKTISSMAEYKRWIDGYDCGIRYADDHVGQVLAALAEQGVLKDTAIIITADHGENQGELNYYGSHRTGDHVTLRVPMIVRWPGVTQPGTVDNALHYQHDVSATILDVLGIQKPARWHAQSFANALRGHAGGRDSLVVGQLACMAQRSVRWDDWMLLRTWHDGFSRFPEFMLFDVKNDPHELNDQHTSRPELVKHGLALMESWHDEMMRSHPAPEQIDPLEIVLREEPFWANSAVMKEYCKRLRETGRAHHAVAIEKNRGQPIK